MFFCGLFPLFLAAAPAAAKTLLPPTLVSCVSETSCEPSSEKLEAFVRDFLNWYVVRDAELEERYQENMSRKKWRKLFVEHHTLTEKAVNHLLTPRFQKWRRDTHLEMPYTNRDFCPPDTNAILCAQDYDDETFQKASFSLFRAEKDLVEIVVVQSPSYKIFVRLKALGGQWRIDGVHL